MLFRSVDYWKYSRGFPMKNTLNDAKEKYQKEIHQYRDKIFRIILDDKKEFLEFLKMYEPGLGFENLKEEDIEKYNRKFVTSGMKIRESDIIYKISKKDVFIIVEHQSRVDYDMANRMTEYCVEIIRSVRKKNKHKSPLIFPIVLYTGNKEWTAPLTIDDTQEKFYKVPPQNYPKYDLVDIKNINKEKLITENTGLSKVLLFEKLKTKEDFEKVLKGLLKKNLTDEEIKYIKIMLTYSNFIRKELPDIADEYIEELNKKGESDNMLMFEKLFVEYVKDKEKTAIKKGESIGIKQGKELGIKQGKELGIKQGKELGIKQGKEIGIKRGEKIGQKIGQEKGKRLAIREIAKEMLRREMKDDVIISMTKITAKELEELKNEELELENV